MSGSSAPASGASTPNSRFISQNVEAEDRLKSQTYGLVQLSDFRKRRAEALQQETSSPSTSDGANEDDPKSTPRLIKKTKKVPKKGGLSFGDDETEAESVTNSQQASRLTSRSNTPVDRATQGTPHPSSETEDGAPLKKRFAANAGVGFVAKSMTTNALLRETQMKEQLRKEFLAMQELVKATDFLLPFVFYDGADTPGGVCRMKKGDQIWLFLDRARKLGAEQSGSSGKSMRQWARVSVDDLMFVRGDLIVPPHYDFYFFMLNKTIGHHGPLLPHSAEPTLGSPVEISQPSTPSGLSVPDPLSKSSKLQKQSPATADADLEGYKEDPGLTKVVDRRWYEKNKHIYPASTWEDFDPAKDYSSGVRKDTQGNTFFSSR